MIKTPKDKHRTYAPDPEDYIYGIKADQIMELKNALEMLDLSMEDVIKFMEELSDTYNRSKK